MKDLETRQLLPFPSDPSLLLYEITFELAPGRTTSLRSRNDHGGTGCPSCAHDRVRLNPVSSSSPNTAPRRFARSRGGACLQPCRVRSGRRRSCGNHLAICAAAIFIRAAAAVVRRRTSRSAILISQRGFYWRCFNYTSADKTPSAITRKLSTQPCEFQRRRNTSSVVIRADCASDTIVMCADYYCSLCWCGSNKGRFDIVYSLPSHRVADI